MTNRIDPTDPLSIIAAIARRCALDLAADFRPATNMIDYDARYATRPYLSDSTIDPTDATLTLLTLCTNAITADDHDAECATLLDALRRCDDIDYAECSHSFPLNIDLHDIDPLIPAYDDCPNFD